MLYPYQTAEEHRAPLRERALLRQPAGLLALELVCTINSTGTLHVIPATWRRSAVS